MFAIIIQVCDTVEGKDVVIGESDTGYRYHSRELAMAQAEQLQDRTVGDEFYVVVEDRSLEA
jgi:hypothetical protein